MGPSSERMSRQATRDTAPELALRRRLHGLGFRYRLHQRPLPELGRTADIVFRSRRLAVFVDGCFWHGCPEHATSPKTNGEWWGAKLARNTERDMDTDRRLTEAGWRVVRVWEHEDPLVAGERIAAILRASPP
jgi:DNA mismatch endonuclease (patch repair protein)